MLLTAAANAVAPAASADRSADRALLLRGYTMWGGIALHWTLVLTLGLSCFIVRAMNRPA